MLVRYPVRRACTLPHLSPADFTRPDNWLPGITPVMAQVIKKYQKLTVKVVTEVVGDFIVKKWKRQGICLWQEDFFFDASRQNWMGRSQPSQMPQQDSFHNNFQTALASYWRSCRSRILWHLQGLVHKMEASPQTAM